MTFKGTLFPYQPEAVDRMCDEGRMLVAYDLGLGKTVLTIAAIEKLMDEQKIKEPGLIICLSSLKYQWANQIEKFTDDTSRALVIDGTPKKREEQYAQALDWKTSGVDYIILNYEQVVNDWDHVKDLPRGFVVLDEATAIKSFKSKRSRFVKRLSNAPYRFALTGTPIENGKPEELYSIMEFVERQLLGRFDIFDSTFIIRNSWGGVQGYRNLPTLHTKMKSASVRKAQKDPDVAPYLPEAIHNDPVKIVLDRKASKLYFRIVDDLLEELDNAQTLFGGSFNLMAHYGFESKQGGPEDEIRGRIMSRVGCLKMLCSHPDLLRISAAKFSAVEKNVLWEEEDEDGSITRFSEMIPTLGTKGGSAYAYDLVSTGALDGISGSPKLEYLIQYVKDFLEQDEANKVVIFATYVTMLDMIAEALGPEQCRLYSGKLDAKTKEDNKIAFNTDPSIRVLISSDAGGYGVDLPAANLLVNYDLPWSSGTAVQRNGRIKRASSTWPTIVIQDIIISGSIEQRQWEALQHKSAVASAVIDGEGIDEEGGIPMTIGSLKQFLELSSV
jgi:SNF2 family DNA or RNA helicase